VRPRQERIDKNSGLVIFFKIRDDDWCTSEYEQRNRGQLRDMEFAAGRYNGLASEIILAAP
jgi:hypothetical protein